MQIKKATSASLLPAALCLKNTYHALQSKKQTNKNKDQVAMGPYDEKNNKKGIYIKTR